MGNGHVGWTTWRQVHRLFAEGTATAVGEEALLERYVARGDPAAFEALVARHGPMVLGVCRRLLDDPHAVEDAFQSTFLVLVRKAGSLRDRQRLGPWLHGVAHRVAARARANAARRRTRERPGAELIAGSPARDPALSDLRAVLDEEIGRLPGKYRELVVLCHLEGRSYEEAANRLGCPLGTVKVRLSRARGRLRDRLIRRGLAPAAGLLGAYLEGEAASAVVPPSLAEITTRTAAAGATSATVAALTRGVLTTMLRIQRLKAATTGLLMAGVLAAGLVALPWTSSGDDRPGPSGPEPPAASPPPTKEAPPRPQGAEAKAIGPVERRLRAETDLEVLELDVGIMAETLHQYFESVRKLEDAPLADAQARGPAQYRPQAYRHLSEEAAKQLAINRQRYLEQRQRLRRLRTRLPGDLRGDGAADRVGPSAGELGDQVEQAEVDLEVGTLEAEALKTRVETVLRLLRTTEFQLTRPPHPRPTEEERQTTNRFLEEMRKECEATREQYLEAKLARDRIERRLAQLRDQYQATRKHEDAQRIVREGDTLSITYPLNSQGLGPRVTRQFPVDEDGFYVRQLGNIPVPTEPLKVRVAGLPARQAAAEIVKAIRIPVVAPDPREIDVSLLSPYEVEVEKAASAKRFR